MLTVHRRVARTERKGNSAAGDRRRSLEISGYGFTNQCHGMGSRFATFPQRGIRASWATASLAHSPFLLTYLIFIEGLESFYRWIGKEQTNQLVMRNPKCMSLPPGTEKEDSFYRPDSPRLHSLLDELGTNSAR
jgi:hypothetical protein